MIGAVDGIRGPQRGRPDVAQAFDYVRETMFSDSNGDRPRANNYVVLLSGNDRSVNTNRAIQAAQRLKVLSKDLQAVVYDCPQYCVLLHVELKVLLMSSLWEYRLKQIYILSYASEMKSVPAQWNVWPRCVLLCKICLNSHRYSMLLSETIPSYHMAHIILHMMSAWWAPHDLHRVPSWSLEGMC